MTPNVYDIIRTSLEIAPKIIFFLPRTLDIYELCEIIESILQEKDIDILEDEIARLKKERE